MLQNANKDAGIVLQNEYKLYIYMVSYMLWNS